MMHINSKPAALARDSRLTPWQRRRVAPLASLAAAALVLVPIAPGFASEPPASGISEIAIGVEDRVSDDGSVLADGIDFDIDYATGLGKSTDGITVLQTDSEDVRAYVQPAPNGVRVLTAIASADAPDSYSYTFDVPEGTALTESMVGYHPEHDTEVLGAVYQPWARDSNGKELRTSYAWTDGVLTQHVDLESPDIVFPVLLDPYWGYTFSYNLSKTPSTAWGDLQSCFNCEFPVYGAPAAFPSYNQLLPLEVGWPGVATQNFECRMASTFTNPPNYYGWQFNATSNHIDGYGSNIIFEIKYVGSQSKLVVDAYIVNDFWLGNQIYASGAGWNWLNFATNLSN